MSVVSVHDVAAYVTKHFSSPISTMKLQKLVYFAQGWHLGITGRKLFEGRFEAWAKGPVSPTLYAHHRREYAVSEWPAGDATLLQGFEKAVVDAVLSNYGALSGIQLSEITHVPDGPWALARTRAGVSEGQRSQLGVNTEDMSTYFAKHLGVNPAERPRI